MKNEDNEMADAVEEREDCGGFPESAAR